MNVKCGLYYDLNLYNLQKKKKYKKNYHWTNSIDKECFKLKKNFIEHLLECQPLI